ncbi:MAG: undecaprenyl-diphosphate phosphatase [Erysipelotrichaceae bacterium]|nr:undecaprenyl-diphosphate phosphatase [Erysipelotrichaceae bacterium]MBR3693713.1 undecaprenyl-diphosphate phosphatase [Erysipelotrichales bacterium]
MLIIKYIILGIIQGITEPLPISSSGHLVLVKSLINVETQGSVVELLVHFGSLLAILFYYRDDVIDLIVSFFTYLTRKTKNTKDDFFYIWKLVLATIPAGIVGLLFKDQIEVVMQKPMYVGFALIFTAIVIFISCKQNTYKSREDITYLDAFKIGLMQMVALVPGISRSGSTTCAGMLCGIKREDSMKFAFLLFIPIGLLACLSGIPDFLLTDFSVLGIPYLLCFIASTVTTYFAILLLNRLLISNKYIYFSYYCLIVGVIAVIFLR